MNGLVLSVSMVNAVFEIQCVGTAAKERFANLFLNNRVFMNRYVGRALQFLIRP